MLKAVKKKIEIHLSPVKVYERVRSWDSCLLQSGNGDFSMIGFDPFIKLVAKDGKCCVSRKGGDNWQDLKFDGEPLDVLQKLIDEFSVEENDFDLPFVGGGMGYFSYDFGVGLAGVEQKTEDDIGTPDLYWLFFDQVLIFDHREKCWWLVVLGLNEVKAEEKLLQLEKKFNEGRGGSFGVDGNDSKLPKSELSKEEYAAKLGEIDQFLREGETYELNFAHRFHGRTNRDSWEIYCDLVEKNPSPYMCYFQGSEDVDLQVVSNSPERLVVCRNGVLETRPIKGTVPRGKTAEEEAVYEKELLASGKTEAELNMIVDLARNDLGQVAEIGSVEVTEHRVVEKYSHVQHTMSNVRAKKREDANFSDVVKAMFPGGSVTGAPKKRTMELIDQLEYYRRGVYCGSAGYVSFGGDFDLNIMIRTVTCRKGDVWFHSGGAIVVDSVVNDEWQETLDKAGALMECILK